LIKEKLLKMISNKILITGAAGNIGSSLCNKLLKNINNKIIAIDNLSTGNLNNLNYNKKNFVFIKVDINNKNKVKKIFSKYKFDYIFHYAAVVGVKRTLNNPLKVLEDIEGIKNILNNAITQNVKRIFYSSSSEVYGEPFETPQNELTTPLNSRLPYAIVKNVCESYIKSYNAKYGINYTIMRLFNTYGPRQSADFVITNFLLKAKNNQNLQIYGSGNQTRSFIYIDDNINFTIKIFNENLLINETINLGNNQEISIIDLAKLIIKITKSKSKINFKPSLKEGDMSNRKPDIKKMKKIYKSKLIDLENGINKTFKFINKNESNFRV